MHLLGCLLPLLLHDGDPQHSDCPMDPDTWYPYIHTIYNNQELTYAKPLLISPDLVGCVKRCWARLCKPKLLKRCILVAVQNQNESLNNLIWRYCPKTEFCGLVSL